MELLTAIRNLLENQTPIFLSMLLLWASLLLSGAWLITALLHRASPSVRYCVWQFALAGLLVLPALFAVLPGVPLGFSLNISKQATAGPTSSSSALVSLNGTRRATESDSVAQVEQRTIAPLTRNPAHSSELGTPRTRRIDHEAHSTAKNVADTNTPQSATAQISWQVALAIVWGMGAFTQIIWLWSGIRRAECLTRHAAPLNDPRIVQIHSELAKRFGLLHSTCIMSSPQLSTPVVIGALRPRILLPAGAVDWADLKIRLVLAHELAHVERRDILWQLIARAAVALYWFHPLAWLGHRRMREERERACDDRVLSMGVPAIDYATQLVEVASALAGRSNRIVGAVGIAERLPPEDRVRSILDGTLSRNPASRRSRRLMLIVTAALVVTLGVLRPFKPVAADEPPTKESKTVPSPVAPKPTSAPAKEESSEAKIKDEPKQLSTKGSMLIRVIGPNDQPIAGAKLFANVSHWNKNAEPLNRWVIKNNDYVTRDDGTIEITLPKLVEDIRLWVRKDGYAPMFAIWWPKHQPDLSSIPHEFTYHLTEGTVLGGVINDETGKPIEKVRVEVRYDSDSKSERADSAVFDTWLSEGDDAIVTDSKGRWTLNNVPPGNDIKILLKLSHPDFISDKSWGGFQKEQRITLPSLREQSAVMIMKRATPITGKVKDPDGKPIKDAIVIWGDRPYWEHLPQQEVRTDEQGVYRFPALAPGDMHVTVVAKGWMPQRVTTRIVPEMPPLDFTMKPGKKMLLRFVDKSGAPVPLVGVSIASWRGAESLHNMKHSNVLDTGIPSTANLHGVYEWDWAPDDPVTLQCGKEGYAAIDKNFTADDTEQVVTLFPRLRFAGKVMDAQTGQPIRAFTVVPTIHFRSDFPSVERELAEDFKDGQFEMEFDRGDVTHSVLIEAKGYVTQCVGPYATNSEPPAIELKLKPAERFVGRVVNESGIPVAHARVYIGSYSEHLYLSNLFAEDGGRSDNYRVKTDDQGAFEIAHQLERYSLIVVSDEGYAEAERAVGSLPGELKIKHWAKISGHLMQGGKPVPNCGVKLEPIRDSSGDAPRGNVRFHCTTTDSGAFTFERAPPIPCRVEGMIHWSVEGPLSSGQSVPLDLAPGEQRAVDLGAKGAEVIGQLALDPPMNREFDYHFGLNYLVARKAGIAPPTSVANRDFDWRKGWSDSWTASTEGAIYLQTLPHFFVKPDPDGRFRISGVEPGEYDLAFRLYGSTEGCLLQPLATTLVRVNVKEGESTLDLGTVKVTSLPVLKTGDAAPDFEFTDTDGRQRSLSQSRGRYVLLDFWATWCGPCVSSLSRVESLRQKYVERPGLEVIGINLDQDPQRAKVFLQDRKLPWSHALLGDWSSTDAPKRFAVSSMPTYILISPEGTIVAHETSLEAIEHLLEKMSSANQ